MERCLQAQVQAFFTAWTEGSASVAYMPQGLAQAGSEGQLRNAANAALLAMVHARHSSGFYGVRLACWARGQVLDMSNAMPVGHVPIPQQPASASMEAIVQPASASHHATKLTKQQNILSAVNSTKG